MADEKLNMSPEEKDAGEKGPAKKDKAAKEKTPEPDKPKGRGGRKAKEENAGLGEQSGTAPKGKPWSGGWSPEPPGNREGRSSAGLTPAMPVARGRDAPPRSAFPATPPVRCWSIPMQPAERCCG